MQSSQTSAEKEHYQYEIAEALFTRIKQGLNHVGLTLAASETHLGDVIYVVRGEYYEKTMKLLTADDQKGFMDFELRRWTQEDEWRKEN